MNHKQTEQTTHRSQVKTRGSVSIAVTSTGQYQDNTEVAAGKCVRVEIPENFSEDHCAVAVRDTEIIGELIKNHPKEICLIMEAVHAGKNSDVKKIAEQIGFTEENFIKLRGGCWAVVIVIAVAAALTLEHD
jgi:hypothetical protein